MDKTKLQIMVEPDVAEKLATLAGGPRKMGDYISELVRQLHDGSPNELHIFARNIRAIKRMLEREEKNAL